MVLKFIGFVVLLCALSDGLNHNYSPYYSGSGVCFTHYGNGTCKKAYECVPFIRNQITKSDIIPCHNKKICCPLNIGNLPQLKVPEYPRRTASTTSTIPLSWPMNGTGNQRPEENKCITDRKAGNCSEGALCESKIGSGKCTQLQECGPLMKGSISYQKLSRCTFVGTNEIICCPTTADEPKREHERPQTSTTTALPPRREHERPQTSTTTTLPPRRGHERPQTRTTTTLPPSSVITTSQQSSFGQGERFCNATSQTGYCFEKSSCLSVLGKGICRKLIHCETKEFIRLEQCSRQLFCCPEKKKSQTQLSVDDLNRSNRGPQRINTNSSSRTVTTTSKPIPLNGRSCSAVKGGTCTDLYLCRAYMSGKIEKSKLFPCSISAHLQHIVCCPPVSTKPVSSMRPAKKACEIYKKENPKRQKTHSEGVREINVGEFPHIGFIIYADDGGNPQYMLNCGVALVSQTFALTTANCARTLTFSDIVLFGTVETNLAKAVSTGHNAKIKHIWLNDENIKEEDYHDLALIEFKTKVPLLRTVHPACLHVEPDDLPKEVNLTVNGWTTTNPLNDYTSPVLYASTVNTIQLPGCNFTHYNELGVTRRFFRGVQHGQYCTRNVNPEHCDGDVGFPLTNFVNEQFEIVGILSMEFGCSSHAPSIYTRVANYIDWIEETVWPNSN